MNGEEMVASILEEMGANKQITQNPMGSFELKKMVRDILLKSNINRENIEEHRNELKQIIEESIKIGENGSITYDDVEVDSLESVQLRRNVRKRFEVDENGNGIRISETQIADPLDSYGQPKREIDGSHVNMTKRNLQQTVRTIDRNGIEIVRDTVNMVGYYSPEQVATFTSIPTRFDLVSSYPNIIEGYNTFASGSSYSRDTIVSMKSNPGLISVSHKETDEARQTQDYTYMALRHGEDMASIQPEYSAVSTATRLWEETKNHQQFADEMRKHFPEVYGIDEESERRRNEAIKKKIQNSHYYGKYGYMQRTALESYVKDPNTSEKDEEETR